MKMIAFNASPRKNGNTAWAIKTILESAQKQGAETQSWSCRDLDIKPCQSCFACHKDGSNGCAINDDMQKLYKEMESAELLILGTPIYMGQMTAQAKTFVDRLFAKISPRFSPHYKEKEVKRKLILVFTQGNPERNMFQVYIDYTKQMFQMLEFDVIEVVVIKGTRSEAAHEKKELHATLENIGSSLVKKTQY